ncbi:MAG: lipoyl(octanoyl) transferase LipB [Tidjanibacter sp.]|nr:lipoyl(octanoyl) transferase LipB [Tidjanibacter sp.]MBR2424427.1 lipoyl(octanoyl) transferase LipB [Tidjanibacter sp.]MBR3682920.1 lipoyl(octanoyl) transferase LipB [Tidjanibacter sp.]
MAVELDVVDVGTMAYGECWQLQQRLFDEAIAAKAKGERPAQRMLLVEHTPVYTLGKSGHESNLLVAETFLKSIGAEFYHIDRGGDITFHGPGQIVGYPILDLEQLGIGLKSYIGAIEGAVIDTMAEWGIACRTVEGAAGVWIVEPGRPMRKVCAIGVRSSRWVTMHGFALNVNTDLRYFGYINPCGFTDRTATSMEAELGERVDPEVVKERLVAHLAEKLDVDKINIKRLCQLTNVG